MKISCDDYIVVFLNNLYIKALDLNDKCKLELFINKIISKYDIKLNGFIDVKIYYDKNYGIICVIKNCDDYVDYFGDIDMNVELINDTFLYKVYDIYSFQKHLSEFTIYKYKGELYLKCSNISSYKLGMLLENSDIVYGNNASKIIKDGVILESEVVV